MVFLVCILDFLVEIGVLVGFFIFLQNNMQSFQYRIRLFGRVVVIDYNKNCIVIYMYQIYVLNQILDFLYNIKLYLVVIFMYSVCVYLKFYYIEIYKYILSFIQL